MIDVRKTSMIARESSHQRKKSCINISFIANSLIDGFNKMKKKKGK